MNYATLRAMTADELFRSAAAFVEELGTAKGYDTYVLDHIRIYKNEIRFVCALQDHFQRDLDYNKRFKSSWGLEITITPNDTTEAIFAAWPGRATRELHVLADRMSSVIEFRSHLISAAGTAFVEDVIKARDRWLALPKHGE